MITSKDYANVINLPIGYSSSELQSDKFSLNFLNNNMSLNMLCKMIKNLLAYWREICLRCLHRF